jgi:hypothetical protein
MKRNWTRSLALSLGLLAGAGAHAQETVWHSTSAPAAALTTPAASIGKPIVIAATPATPAPGPVADAPGAPVRASSGVIATIGKPVPIASAPRADGQVMPAGFSVPDPTAPVVRAQAPELIPAMPMPTGSTGDGDKSSSAGATPAPGSNTAFPSGGTPTLHGWHRADDVVASSGPYGGSTMLPPPSTMGPGMTMGPGGHAPLFTGAPDPCGPSCGPDCGVGSCCGGSSAAGCGGWSGCGCPPCNRWYVSAEYLLWWLKGDPTPPLVTAGSLPVPTQSVLFGGHELATDPMSGARIGAGWWFTDNHLWGIEADGFYVGTDNTFSVFSNGTPALGRPIFDQSPLAFIRDPATGFVILPAVPNPRFGQQNAQLVAFAPTAIQGGLAGGVDVARRTDFWGVDVNLRRNLLYGAQGGFLDAYFGFKMLGLDESLSITESLLAVGNTIGVLPSGATTVLVPNGSTIVVNDRFATSNRFYGGQAGFKGEWRFGAWSIDGNAGIAIGSTQQTVTISGATVTSVPGMGTTGGLGGLLALNGTNIGHYSRDRFGVVPELGLNLGYQFTPVIRGFVGYNFIYWSDVVRPGQQIDLNVNRTFQPGSAIPRTGAPVPGFPFTSTDFWAQGLTVGLEFRF